MRTGAPIRLALKDAAAARRSFARILRAFYVGAIDEPRFVALDSGFATLARLFEVETRAPSVPPVPSSPDPKGPSLDGQAGRFSSQNDEKAPRTRPDARTDDSTSGGVSTQPRASAVRPTENVRDPAIEKTSCKMQGPARGRENARVPTVTRRLNV